MAARAIASARWILPTCRASPHPSTCRTLLTVASTLGGNGMLLWNATAASGTRQPQFFQGARRSQPLGGVRCVAGTPSQLVELIKEKNAENPVIIYSKTWCPYCGMVKGLFKKLGVAYKAVELDELADGDELQDALRSYTGQSTVPSVFIGGEHIGGCDDTMALHSQGNLIPKLEASGAQMLS
eukprot:TRINITY_DN18759_c0_g1_i1.p1 TRINITY_DN18759_c0_g1~~TRINITY_DN18759_c0_g1_i1.p1  ORF type:complete len:183 (+),score=26.64 TRINITY_DN18759_c0_g1_i1:61-609(+)